MTKPADAAAGRWLAVAVAVAVVCVLLAPSCWGTESAERSAETSASCDAASADAAEAQEAQPRLAVLDASSHRGSLRDLLGPQAGATLVRNLPLVADWSALHRWPVPEQLLQDIGPQTTLHHTYTRPASGEAVFRHFEDGTLWQRSYNLERDFATVNVTAERFFSSANSEHRYWSGLLADLGPRATAAAPDIASLSMGREIRAVRAWMSTDSVQATLHYDVFHNAFVQVAGRKHFVLFPPARVADVYLHPSLHPMYRQSQVFEATSPDSTSSFASRRQFPRFPWEEAIRVTVEPGDVLYLPPFWLHGVTAAGNFSTSLTVWSTDEAFEEAEQMFGDAIPFEEEWDEHITWAALAVYAPLLVEEVLAVDPPQFFEHAWRTRFEPALAAAGAVNPELTRVTRDRIRRDLCGTVLDDEDIVAEWRKQFMRGVVQVQTRLADIETPEVREVYLQDFVEEMVSFFVGISLDHAMAYYWHCLVLEANG